MKKVTLLVVVFLVGMTAQAQKRYVDKNVYQNQGNHRYYNSQVIRFVENGVLYKVATNGTFDFTILNRPYTSRPRGRRNHEVNYNGTPGHIYNGGRRSGFIKTDRFGNIHSIGRTQITYKRNGKVRSIGRVPLYYKRGRLVQIGNMQIVYNRFGKIRDTHGIINRLNRKVWHDDWYYLNDRNEDWFDNDDWDDDWDDDYFRGNRKRKKNI